ncbi:four helix bundle protein [Diaphorobacter limosus]|uniref:Four helix bundle protein n=1 Tax=Diaphorobacter limosus TaxID=3036128 RepID=A0ABZ0J0Q8_9BURK|nr:four helix bundle protein [Diaphorobacter sp. Y-1]WOO31810.1 four helix bundle protein [Diaphorobacter sp. Y-1]
MNHPSARGPRYRQLPLWRDAQRLLLQVELAVRDFARYHKYTLGSELRQQAMAICRLVARAAQQGDVQRRVVVLERLVWGLEDFKIRLQLAKELQAFASFAQFQALAELAVALGKQSGGWCKKARSVAAQASRQGAGAA